MRAGVHAGTARGVEAAAGGDGGSPGSEAATHHASGGRHSDAPPVALRRVRCTTRVCPSHEMTSTSERIKSLRPAAISAENSFDISAIPVPWCIYAGGHLVANGLCLWTEWTWWRTSARSSEDGAAREWSRLCTRCVVIG